MQYSMDHSVADRLGFDFTLLLSVLALKLVSVDMLPSAPYLTYLDMYMLSTYVFIVGVAAETSVRLACYGTTASDDRIPFYCAASAFTLYNCAFVLSAARTRGATTTAMIGWLEVQMMEETYCSEDELDEMSPKNASRRRRLARKRVSPVAAEASDP